MISSGWGGSNDTFASITIGEYTAGKIRLKIRVGTGKLLRGIVLSFNWFILITESLPESSDRFKYLSNGHFLFPVWPVFTDLTRQNLIQSLPCWINPALTVSNREVSVSYNTQDIDSCSKWLFTKTNAAEIASILFHLQNNVSSNPYVNQINKTHQCSSCLILILPAILISFFFFLEVSFCITWVNLSA